MSDPANLGGLTDRERPASSSTPPLELRLSDDELAVLTHRDAANLVEANEQLVIATLRTVAAEEALRESVRRKDEFLAMLGHELRNPLAAIRNAAELLKADDGKDQSDWLYNVLVRQVGHLTRLVDDLSDIALVARGVLKLQMGAVDLNAVIKATIEDTQPLIQARHHQLTLHCPDTAVWVDGDEIRLAQVVGNLLANAAKYTDDHGEITVRLAVADATAVLTVSDSGLGIAPDMLPRIFELFVQDARAVDRSQGGLGIGLALVRHLVDIHNGSIQAFSDGPGMGSKFVVRFPLRPSGEPVSSKNENTSSSSIRVMVVDDDVEAGHTLAMVLGSRGIQARTAVDLPSALHVARAFVPQMVLMDIAMPGADGYEVARQLRTLPELQGATYAALSGFGKPEDLSRSQEAGFVQHFVKPTDPKAILMLIIAIFGTKP
jgi:signal transduction histidine kinase/CheY-like chemotaxis protein